MPPIGPQNATLSTGWVHTRFPPPPSNPPPRPGQDKHTEAAALLSGRYRVDMSSAASSESSEGSNTWGQSLRGFCSTAGEGLYNACNAFTTRQVTMGAATLAAGGVMLAAGGIIGGIVATAAAGAAVKAAGGSGVLGSTTATPLDLGSNVYNQRPVPPVQTKIAFWSQVESSVKFEALDLDARVDSSVTMPGKGMAMIKTNGKIGFVRASAEGAGKSQEVTGRGGGCYVAFKEQTGGGKPRIQIERQKYLSADDCMDNAVRPLLSERNITIRAVSRNGYGTMAAECWDASGNSVGSGTGDSVEIETAAANGPFSCKTHNKEKERGFVWMNKVDARSVGRDIDNNPFACVVNSREFALSEVKTCISKSDCQPKARTTPAPTTTQSDATASDATPSSEPHSTQGSSDTTQENTTAS